MPTSWSLFRIGTVAGVAIHLPQCPLCRVWGLLQQQLLRRNVKRFRGGLVFKAHRLLYHSTLGSRVLNKKKEVEGSGFRGSGFGFRVSGSGIRVPCLGDGVWGFRRGNGPP